MLFYKCCNIEDAESATSASVIQPLASAVAYSALDE